MMSPQSISTASDEAARLTDVVDRYEATEDKLPESVDTKEALRPVLSKLATAFDDNDPVIVMLKERLDS